MFLNVFRNLWIQDTCSSYSYMFTLDLKWCCVQTLVTQYIIMYTFNKPNSISFHQMLLKCECTRESLINKTVDCGKVERTGARFMAEVLVLTLNSGAQILGQVIAKGCVHITSQRDL